MDDKSDVSASGLESMMYSQERRTSVLDVHFVQGAGDTHDRCDARHAHARDDEAVGARRDPITSGFEVIRDVVYAGNLGCVYAISVLCDNWRMCTPRYDITLDQFMRIDNVRFFAQIG